MIEKRGKRIESLYLLTINNVLKQHIFIYKLFYIANYGRILTVDNCYECFSVDKNILHFYVNNFDLHT